LTKGPGGQKLPQRQGPFFLAETWSSQLIECVLPSGAEGERAAGSWKGAIL